MLMMMDEKWFGFRNQTRKISQIEGIERNAGDGVEDLSFWAAMIICLGLTDCGHPALFTKRIEDFEPGILKGSEPKENTPKTENRSYLCDSLGNGTEEDSIEFGEVRTSISEVE
jgi:hypothetical protein